MEKLRFGTAHIGFDPTRRDEQQSALFCSAGGKGTHQRIEGGFAGSVKLQNSPFFHCQPRFPDRTTSRRRFPVAATIFQQAARPLA